MNNKSAMEVAGLDKANDQSLMIMDMERKLNAGWFSTRMNRKDYCKMSSN